MRLEKVSHIELSCTSLFAQMSIAIDTAVICLVVSHCLAKHRRIHKSISKEEEEVHNVRRGITNNNNIPAKLLFPARTVLAIAISFSPRGVADEEETAAKVRG